MRRLTKTNPCSVCGGWDSLKRGVGQRCFGFISKDGVYAHCTRRELAGNLSFKEKSMTYPHLLAGLCKCGKHHARAGRVAGREIRDHTLVRRHKYKDANSELVFEVLRYEPKGFRQRRPDGEGGWVWNLDGVEPLLYRLPLKKVKRKGGYTWMLRYRVKGSHGRRVENTMPVGLVRDFPRKKDARHEVDKLGLIVRINGDLGETRHRFDALAEQYLKNDFGVDAVRPKTERTILNTEHIVRAYLIPRWGEEIADDIKPLDIQRWLIPS